MPYRLAPEASPAPYLPLLMSYPLQVTYLLAPGCPTCWLLMPYLLAADTLRPTRWRISPYLLAPDVLRLADIFLPFLSCLAPLCLAPTC